MSSSPYPTPTLISLLSFSPSMIRPLPTPTLFPYTTLFRSVTARDRDQLDAGMALESGHLDEPGERGARIPAPSRHRRSEEHTSELQSLRHLVCRLLLEKKKTERLDCEFEKHRGSTWYDART